MWPDKRLLELLQIEHPIIQAPMAGSSTVAMAAAAANAGCMGSHGCAMMAPEVYKKTFDDTRALTNGTLNMNFFCHNAPSLDAEKAKLAQAKLVPFYDEFGLGEVPEVKPTHFPFDETMMDAVLETRPNVISFHFGLPDQNIVEKLKQERLIILCSATTQAEAKDLEARGVDAIIAQGWEAGGHHGFYLKDHTAAIGTIALVPQLVDAVDIPIIAAGGIADGRGIAAAFALGAAGVQIGTAFLTCNESGVPEPHRQSLLQSDGSNTKLTKVFSGRPARGLRNRYMEEMSASEDELPDFPLMNTLTGPLRKASASSGKPDFVSQWSGQGVALNRTNTVSELIEQLIDETRVVFEGLSDN